MSRTHITRHAYEDMFEELYPTVRTQYKRRMRTAAVVLVLAVLFTLYIFTVGECRRLPFAGSIAEIQSAALTRDAVQENEQKQEIRDRQKKGEDRDAKRISDQEYAGLSLAGQ